MNFIREVLDCLRNSYLEMLITTMKYIISLLIIHFLINVLINVEIIYLFNILWEYTSELCYVLNTEIYDLK